GFGGRGALALFDVAQGAGGDADGGGKLLDGDAAQGAVVAQALAEARQAVEEVGQLGHRHVGRPLSDGARRVAFMILRWDRGAGASGSRGRIAGAANDIPPWERTVTR